METKGELEFNIAADICKSAKIAKNPEDFLNIQCRISDLFTQSAETEIKEIIKNNNFYILVIQNIFNNPNFLEAIRKVAEQYRAFKKNYTGQQFWHDFKNVEIEKKKVIFIALTTSTSFFCECISLPYFR